MDRPESSGSGHSDTGRRKTAGESNGGFWYTSFARSGPPPPAAAPQKQGRTLLHMAAWEGRAFDVRGLVAAGASVHAADVSGATPLHLAAKAGYTKLDILFREDAAHQLETVEALLAAGADVHAADAHGRQPLHYAARGGCEATLHALVAAGAEVDAQDAAGWCPLMHAAFRGHARAVQALLVAGADPRLRTHTCPYPGLSRQTPRGLAEGRKKRDCARLLATAEVRLGACIVCVGGLRPLLGLPCTNMMHCSRKQGHLATLPCAAGLAACSAVPKAHAPLPVPADDPCACRRPTRHLLWRCGSASGSWRGSCRQCSASCIN